MSENKKLKFEPRDLGYIKPKCNDFARATEIPVRSFQRPDWDFGSLKTFEMHYVCQHRIECKNSNDKRCIEKIIIL